MAKPKKGMHSGPHKSHGPKRHLFKEFKPMVHEFGRLGVLDKYTNEDSFILAMAARGNKKVLHSDWVKFSQLKTRKEKDAYFASVVPQE